MITLRNPRLALAAVTLAWSATATVSAQNPPAVSQHSEAVAARPAPEDAHDSLLWDLTGGAILNSGNTRTFSGNVGTRFTLRRGDNQLGVEATYTVGTASARDMMGHFADWAENSNNLTSKLRYDRFLTDADALFVSESFRRDHFAGLDARLQTQLGYSRNIVTREKARLWAEGGYDLTYDDYHPNALGTATIHSARLFVGYDNHVKENLTFLAGLEGLMNVETPADTRLNFNAELNTKVSGRLSIGLKFVMRFDNRPPNGLDTLDTTTTLNLVYSLVTADDNAEEEVPSDAAETAEAPASDATVTSDATAESGAAPDSVDGADATAPASASSTSGTTP